MACCTKGTGSGRRTDDLLARTADVVITQTRRAVTAVRRLMAFASHTQEEIDAARAQSDLLLALPALLLRPVPRAATAATRRRSGADAEDAPELHAHPRGANSVSFSATLRRRFQKAEKDEVAELLKEALDECEAKDRRSGAPP